MKKISINEYAEKGIQALRDEVKSQIDNIDDEIETYVALSCLEYARMVSADLYSDRGTGEMVRREAKARLELNKKQLEELRKNKEFHVANLERIESIGPNEFVGIRFFVE